MTDIETLCELTLPSRQSTVHKLLFQSHSLVFYFPFQTFAWWALLCVGKSKKLSQKQMSHLHGPRARFNDLISQIITSQEIDGSELLIIIGMLRERTLREEFLDCLHTKAPYFRLSLLSYNHLLDVMRALLREANNSGDFKSIAAVFTTSRLYGRNVGGFVYSIMKSLPSHEVWSNVSFWMYCTDELISEDIIRWDDLSSNSRKFLNLPDSQVRFEFFLFCFDFIC